MHSSRSVIVRIPNEESYRASSGLPWGGCGCGQAQVTRSRSRREAARAAKDITRLREQLADPSTVWNAATDLQDQVNKALKTKAKAEKAAATCERMLEQTAVRTEQEIGDLRAQAEKAAAAKQRTGKARKKKKVPR